MRASIYRELPNGGGRGKYLVGCHPIGDVVREPGERRDVPGPLNTSLRNLGTAALPLEEWLMIAAYDPGIVEDPTRVLPSDTIAFYLLLSTSLPPLEGSIDIALPSYGSWGEAAEPFGE